jgi:hypothetical protein
LKKVILGRVCSVTNSKSFCHGDFKMIIYHFLKKDLYRINRYRSRIGASLLYQPFNFNYHLNPDLLCRPIQPNVVKKDHT